MFIVPQPKPQNKARNTGDAPAGHGQCDSSAAGDGGTAPALPRVIPRSARIVVRTKAGIDPRTGRMTYRDYVGHVEQWDGNTLEMTRDAAANGSRPEEQVSIGADRIVRLKPVPERPDIIRR